VDELTRLAYAARAGDRAALEAFVRATRDDVWRLCAALLDAGAADDLTQETFARVVPALRRFRGGSSARTWVVSIARRACVDELRSRSRRRQRDARLWRDAGADPNLGPDVAHEVGVRDLLARLSPERREAFALTQLLRLSYGDAAVVCDCPPGTIRSRVARARDDLVAILDEAERAERGGERSACDGRTDV
jgi:RNA polymerase sigma-70 factor (ECF subfamily)